MGCKHLESEKRLLDAKLQACRILKEPFYLSLLLSTKYVTPAPFNKTNEMLPSLLALKALFRRAPETPELHISALSSSQCLLGSKRNSAFSGKVREHLQTE